MKRVGNLMARIVHSDNLREAFLRAARGKSAREEVIAFRCHLPEELASMARELADGTYCFGEYRRFMVFDRKPRQICAAPFRDRVAMHAMMRICHPVFDAYQVCDSYASRPNKGTYAALERARSFARRYEWFVKLDVRRFFDSIDHGVLMQQLSSLFKDRILLRLWEQLVEGYEASPGRGLPIGNLTSQYFANHYLAAADHRLHEQWHVPAAVRYMDDLLLFGDDRKGLKAVVTSYRNFLSDVLRLDLHEPVMNRTCSGVPFLGYVVFPARLHLQLESRRRFRRHLAMVEKLYDDGYISESICRNRIVSLYSYIGKADSLPLRQSILIKKGESPKRPAPIA